MASALIHSKVGQFEKSQYPDTISDEKLFRLRLVLVLMLILSFVFQGIHLNTQILYSLATDIGLFTSWSGILAIWFSHKATTADNLFQPSGPEIRDKRHALIWNSITITINIMVVVVYFIFIPITLASDGKMTFTYYLNFNTLAFILSFTAVILHFIFVKFAMLERDYKWISISLCMWALANITVEVDSLLFSELKGAKNLIKIALSAFVTVATTCMYIVLCELSQSIKGIKEKDLQK